MDLHQSITKAFSIAAFFGLTLAPQDGSRGAGSATSGGGGPGNVPIVAAIPAALAATSTTGDPSAGQPGPCGEGMVLIEGDYCPDAEQTCLKWLDPPPYQNLRCGEYAKPAKCKVPRQRRRFCVDREEFAESAPSPCPTEATTSSAQTPATAPVSVNPPPPAGDPAAAPASCIMPIVNKSWTEAKALCEARGARLCKESEWEFACEGPDMSPYPYGWKRDSTVCNFDKTSLGGPMEKLKDLRAPISAFPECRSPFGVHDMVGNVDEWVERENSAPPYRSALRGGWWLPGRNRCRAATTAHDEGYSGKQVGFRCCKDAP